MSRKQISNIITGFFLFIFVMYALNNPESIKEIANVPLWAIVLVAIGKLLTYFNNGLFTKWTAEQFVPKIRLVETVYISILSAIGNFLGPLLGGTTVRAVFMKKVYKLSYSKFASTLAGYYVILFIANSLLALVSLLFLPDSRLTPLLLFFFGSLLIVLILILFLKLPRKSRWNNINNKYAKFIVTIIYDIEDGWSALKSNRKLLLRLSMLGFVGFVITYMTAAVEFKAIGEDITYSALGLYTSLVVMSMLISLTPGALGIREGILLIVGTTMGITNEQIIQVAVIDRGVNYIMLLVLFLLTRTKKINTKINPTFKI